MRLRKRVPSDMSQVQGLLGQAGLPADGLDQTSGWVAETEASVVGHVAIEPTPDAVVIRSLVVGPSCQGLGLGERLMATAEAAAEGRVLVLKTDTVGPWMLRRGYRIATLNEVPASVRSTTQFSGSLCAGTLIYLKENTMNNDTIKSTCGCSTSCCQSSVESAKEPKADMQAATKVGPKKVLAVDLFVIDLTSCKRCVPTGEQLKAAVDLLTPVADALGIELRHQEIVVETVEQAKEVALLSSPTIRLNGRDVVQDIRESLCESCGDLTDNETAVDCREWHYRGQVYSAAPLPLLLEAIMGAMLSVDTPTVVPSPLKDLPENLQRYFKNKKPAKQCC